MTLSFLVDLTLGKKDEYRTHSVASTDHLCSIRNSYEQPTVWLSAELRDRIVEGDARRTWDRPS